MFYDLEDYASQYRETINPACVNPNIPKVDNVSLDCTELISTDCVVTSKGYPYMAIGKGETVTSVIEKIKEKFKSISFTIQNLGSGIGILKGFSGGVLTAKTIAAGNNIQLTEANDTITINAIGGGSGGGVIDVTHAQLVTFKNNNQLTPGTFYRITDFRTMYDQPDFDANGVAKTSVAAKLGPIEPIIVLALTNNTLSSKAHQEAYPKDVIEYMLEFTTPVNNTVTKGRIIYRKDEWGNETDFDHRNVLFKRYLHPLLSGIGGSFYDTSLASSEKKFITQFNLNISKNNKAFGHFSRFLDATSSLDFDLPNIVLSPEGTGVFNDLTFDTYCLNLTILDGKNSQFSNCSNSFIQVTVNNSNLHKIHNSNFLRYGNNPIGDDSYGIYKSNISDSSNSVIVIDRIYSSYARLTSVNLGRLELIDSEVKIASFGTPVSNSIPSDILTIYSSKITQLIDSNGVAHFSNTYLPYIEMVTFLSNTIENVRGGEISAITLKQNETISNINILSDISGDDFSASTIIYSTGLSKEIIQHPNGLYIKHYDQFGAAVINNVNA